MGPIATAVAAAIADNSGDYWPQYLPEGDKQRRAAVKNRIRHGESSNPNGAINDECELDLWSSRRYCTAKELVLTHRQASSLYED